MRLILDQKESAVKPALKSISLASIALLVGCASASGELRKNLRAYGMSKSEAKCVTRELVDDLDGREIKSINRILGAGRSDGTTRPSQVIVAVRELDDPRVIRSVALANAGCLLLN